jgi:hypothetical protein
VAHKAAWVQIPTPASPFLSFYEKERKALGFKERKTKIVLEPDKWGIRSNGGFDKGM